MKEIKNIQIDDETYEICGGGTSEKEWTVIMDELLTEDTQAIVKSNINFREIQVFVELQPSDAQKTIYLTSSSGGNIYGDPRVSINIANTYAGGICFLGIRVISPHMWELTRYLQPYKSGANLQNKVHGTISKIANADFDKPEITGFTLISGNEDYPFKQGDRVTIIGR